MPASSLLFSDGAAAAVGVPVPRDQPALALLEVGERVEAVQLQLPQPCGIVEGCGDADERLGAEGGQGHGASLAEGTTPRPGQPLAEPPYRPGGTFAFSSSDQFVITLMCVTGGSGVAGLCWRT